MKYFLSICFLSFCLNQLAAQEKHFIFIQSDNKQPFYVSVKGKLYSSTASGYLIIPKLVEGNYNLTVGFAQNTFPEQTFTCVIENKDLGFDLKNLNDRGWALFNLQTLDLTMASAENSNVVAKALVENSNAKSPPSVISFEKKKDTVQEMAKPVSVASPEIVKVDDAKEAAVTTDQSPTSPGKAEAKMDETAKADEKIPAKSLASVETDNSPETLNGTAKSSEIRKVWEATDDVGVHLKFIEGSGKNRDTISIIIPRSSYLIEASNKTSSISTPDDSKSVIEASSSVSKENLGSTDKDDIKFLDINMSGEKGHKQGSTTATENKRIMENSNCKNIANEDDYGKLRKKMAMETTDEKMINEAKKFYRNKCFTTSQIKALSTLFLSDEGRLKFFDASFVSVADAGKYPSLQTEFIDPAYVNRFKSLIQ